MAWLTTVADHLGVMALAGDRIGGRVDGAEHIEIDEAVVERGNQRVGHGMREPREIAVGAGRVDDDEIVRLLDRADRLGKARELDRLVLVELGTLSSIPACLAQRRRFSM